MSIDDIIEYPITCNSESRKALYRYFIEGLQIQCALKTDLKNCPSNEIGTKPWKDDNDPAWDWEQYNYRIFPSSENNAAMNVVTNLKLKEDSEIRKAEVRKRVFFPPLIPRELRALTNTDPEKDPDIQEEAFTSLWEQVVELSEFPKSTFDEHLRMAHVRNNVARFAYLTGRMGTKTYGDEKFRHVSIVAEAMGGMAFRGPPHH